MPLLASVTSFPMHYTNLRYLYNGLNPRLEGMIHEVRRKKMKGSIRIEAARLWIPTYVGKNIVRGYARHYGVDLLCAIKELETIGHEITPEYKEQVKKTMENKVKQNQARKLQKAEDKALLDIDFDQDDHFSFIAGYTSGGAPFGISWDEALQDKEEEQHGNQN